MLTLIFLLLLMLTLTVVITLGVWYWFNRENEKAVQIKGLLIEIGNDTSKLLKDMKGLSNLVSEVAQPLLSPSAIDVESQAVKDEIKIEEEKGEAKKVEKTGKIESMGIPEGMEIELESKDEQIEEEVVDKAKGLEVIDYVGDEVIEEVEEEKIDEVEIFTELIQKEDNIIRLEAAMEEWKAKGNQRLTHACAVAIEQLKVRQSGKQELINLWSEVELQMEEDIAS